jgi:MFS family permease
VALAGFALYHATLLPGVDFGDTGSIQTMAGSSLITPRDGYPLYFAIGDLVLRLTRDEPARGMNLASAIEGAVACGLFVLVASELTGVLAAAIAAALLFGVSYTFWSQCVIAEVYALHISFVLATIYLLLRWEQQPSTGRLAAVFACYALGFGNHLSMILLAPGIIVFVFLAEPRGWRHLLSGRVIALAAGLAFVGASQYLWNLRNLWLLPDPPVSLWDALRTFWFDVTKSDWRETMVLNVPQSMLADHLAMYWFDVRQQFGLVIIPLAVLGAVVLARRQPRRAVLLVMFYVANVMFAFSYNVGDAHVFYLPSHLMLAIVASAAVSAFAIGPRRLRALNVAACLLLGIYALARGYVDYPALDRSRDTRPNQWLNAFTAGLDERRHLFLVDLNWQVANGVSYFTKSIAPEILVARMRDVLLYAPALILDNQAAGRDVVVNAQAGRLLTQSYGPLFELTPDNPVLSLRDSIAGVARGSRYVLCVLKPARDFSIDTAELEAATRMLADGRDVALALDKYTVMAGIVGQPPALVASDDRPFARKLRLGNVPVEIRMDAWLNADTIRRMGFGHVIARRRHVLIVERGISFIAFGADTEPEVEAYAANLFANQPRYLVRPAKASELDNVLR